jgi:hypothetical protein
MIHVCIRQCNYSSASNHKVMPSWFSREDFFKVILKECVPTVIFDGDPTDHFVSKYKDQCKLVCIDAGTECKSFQNMVKYVMSQDIPDDDIVNFIHHWYLLWVQQRHIRILTQLVSEKL